MNQQSDQAPVPYPEPPRPHPQAPFGVDPLTGLPYSDKSQVVAGLLQIFLNGFAVGRFYTGHIGMALLQILVFSFAATLEVNNINIAVANNDNGRWSQEFHARVAAAGFFRFEQQSQLR